MTYLEGGGLAGRRRNPGTRDPIDEQTFVVNVDQCNPEAARTGKRDTAIILAYDDSDGWYYHVMGPIVNQSRRGG